MSLANNLRALRKARGLSQQELATRAGVSVGMVFHLEQGRTTDVKLSTIRALAKGLGVDTGELVTMLEKTPRPESKPKKKTSPRQE